METPKTVKRVVKRAAAAVDGQTGAEEAKTATRSVAEEPTASQQKHESQAGAVTAGSSPMELEVDPANLPRNYIPSLEQMKEWAEEDDSWKEELSSFVDPQEDAKRFASLVYQTSNGRRVPPVTPDRYDFNDDQLRRYLLKPKNRLSSTRSCVWLWTSGMNRFYMNNAETPFGSIPYEIAVARAAAKKAAAGGQEAVMPPPPAPKQTDGSDSKESKSTKFKVRTNRLTRGQIEQMMANFDEFMTNNYHLVIDPSCPFYQAVEKKTRAEMENLFKYVPADSPLRSWDATQESRSRTFWEMAKKFELVETPYKPYTAAFIERNKAKDEDKRINTDYWMLTLTLDKYTKEAGGVQGPRKKYQMVTLENDKPATAGTVLSDEIEGWTRVSGTFFPRLLYVPVTGKLYVHFMNIDTFVGVLDRRRASRVHQEMSLDDLAAFLGDSGDDSSMVVVSSHGASGDASADDHNDGIEPVTIDVSAARQSAMD